MAKLNLDIVNLSVLTTNSKNIKSLSRRTSRMVDKLILPV